MVGLCGVFGESRLPAEMVSWTAWRDDETAFRYDDDGVELALSCHPLLAGDQPATVDVDGGDVALWLWGDVYGHGTGDAYTPRNGPPDGSADFCADLYASDGISFATELNGDYLLGIHDREAGTFTFVTDRIASHPIFWTKPTDDTFVFASNVQSLPEHPAVSTSFDVDYLHEYLGLRRVFGIATPLTGVTELPPASVTTVDLDDLSMETVSYWQPHYDPVDRPFGEYVQEVTETLRTVLAEWTHDDLDYGLLLSGGSDSRFVEACIDQRVTAFHNADWMSREAEISKTVAETAGDEFHLLQRTADHEARALERNARASNFSGWFDQAYFTLFEEEIREKADVLVSGLFADTLFGDSALPTRHLSVDPLGNLDLPVSHRIDTIDDYVDTKLTEYKPMPYFTPDRSIREILTDNIHWTPDGVVSHGVQYGTLADLAMYGDYYPLSADTEAIFSRSLAQIRPYRTPFMDNRMLDLQQQIPVKYLLRRNLINAGIRTVEPALAKIPHAGTGVAPEHPFPIQYTGRYLNAFYRKFVTDDSGPEPYLDHRPWPNRRELLSAHPFADDAFTRHEDLLRGLPFLDADQAHRTLEAHQAGDTDNQPILYSLLTLLEMPVTRQLHDEAATDPSVTSSPPQD